MIEIHQIAVGASRGDAITSMMTEVRDRLRTVGGSEIFAFHTDPGLRSVHPLRDFPAWTSGQRVIVYHASMGEPQMTKFLLRRREPIVLVYHNITPSEFFVESAVEIAALAEWGRRELSLIVDQCVLAIAASEYNAADLRRYGYGDVAVAPVGVNPDRLLGHAPDPSFQRRLRDRLGPRYVLSVSQLFPHKRHELVIEAVHLLQTVHGVDVGLAVVGVARSASYRRALEQMIEELAVQRVYLAGEVSDGQLATAYSGAGAFVTASEHEGLAIPPLEAMAFGVPVVARRFGALADTIGSGGMVLEPDAGPRHLAEALAEVLTNEALRTALIRKGAQRIEAWQPDREMARFLDLIAGVL